MPEAWTEHRFVSFDETPIFYLRLKPAQTRCVLIITHGMGEVTNAFVTLKNIGGMELTNLRATLYALDEGRVHPDKTVELTSLPIGYEVTVKLTVDSTYRQETPIQVEVTSDQGLFPREGLASCKDIGVFAPNPGGLNTPAPGNP